MTQVGEGRSKKGSILRDQRRARTLKRRRNKTTRGRLQRKGKSRKKQGKQRFGKEKSQENSKEKMPRDSVLPTIDKSLYCPPLMVGFWLC